MTNFEKINFIYKTLDYEYFGWNHPNRSNLVRHKTGYWAPKGKFGHPKINIDKNQGRYPTWGFLIKLANMSKIDIGEGKPYVIDEVIDYMFNTISNKVNESI